MITINEQQSAALISHELAYQAVEEAFIAISSHAATLFPVVNAAGAVKDSVFSLKSGHTSSVVGWKTGTYWPNNAEVNLPCHHSTIFLLSPKTGELLASVAASKVNGYRTAAADAIAVNLLARKNATHLAVFGTGHQAEHEVMAIAKVRPLAQVLVVGRNKTKVTAFIDKLIAQGIKHVISASAQNACQQADIIVTATTATQPLFEAKWVKAGTHISAMGCDKKGKNELPHDIYHNASLFCDFAEQSTVIGEFQHCPDQHIIEIGKVLQTQDYGRNNDDEMTIFDSSGVAIQDLIIAKKLVDLHVNTQ